MILAIGEILFDQFPEYKRIGGAPLNFAFHLARLNVPVRFISRIGNDDDGREILQQMHALNFPVNDIQISDTHPTGKVLVELNQKGVPSFNILPDVAYDHIELNRSAASILNSPIDLIYFGSLVQRTEPGFKTMQKILSEKHSRTKCLYDINLRPGCYNQTVIVESLKHTDILKLNEEELKVLKKILGYDGSEHSFTDYLIHRFSLYMIALTKGENGSRLYLKGKSYNTGAHAIDNLEDTVGAGDAYASMLALGFLKKWTPEKILKAASWFASRICEIKGAIPSSGQFYRMIQSSA